MCFISVDIYQYILGSFEIVRGMKAPILTHNMEIFSDIWPKRFTFPCTSPRSHGITGAKTDLIHERGCIIDEKLSLSRVKIVQHGPLTLCFRQHITYFLVLLFALLL